MEVVVCAWSLELHQDKWDDPVLLLQEHAVHNSAIRGCFFQRFQRPNHFWRHLHNSIQLDVHITTLTNPCSTGARRKLCIRTIKYRIIKWTTTNKKKFNYLGRLSPRKIWNQQILQSTLPQNILHRTRKLYLQLSQLLHVAARRSCLSCLNHTLLLLHTRISRTRFRWHQLRMVACWTHYVPSLLSRYSSVILVVTFKLATHTRFWSMALILSIIITSLGFYVAYMWVSNFYFSHSFQNTTETAWSTP